MTARPQHLTPPGELFDGWGAAQLDLDAWRQRVEYDGPLRADLATLSAVCRAQVTHIPFENLDVFLGRDIALDLESLQRKLIRDRRGGYCYEHAALLAAVCESAGFRFTAALARVRMGTGQLRPTSHAGLIVHLDDGPPWLADTGFGGQGLLEPIQIIDGNEAAQGGWRFRVDKADDTNWVLSRAREADWLDLYSFTLEPRYLPDFVTANHFTSTHPRSPFTGRLLAQTTAAEVRQELNDTEWTKFRAGQPPTTTPVPVDNLPAVLDEQFGIALTDTEADDLVRAGANWAEPDR